MGNNEVTPWPAACGPQARSALSYLILSYLIIIIILIIILIISSSINIIINIIIVAIVCKGTLDKRRYIYI
jgi:hypothetical protein